MGMYSRRHNRRQIVYIYLVNSLEWKKITGCKETLLETLYITPFTFCLHNLYILCLLQSWLIIHILASWSVERILRSMSIHLRRFRWLTFRWMTVLPESLKCICNICKLTYLCIYYRLSLPVCLVICISVCLPLNMSIYPFAYLAVSVSVYPFTYNAYVQTYVVHYVDLCKLVFVYINLPWQLILIFIYKVNEWKIQKKMKEKKKCRTCAPVSANRAARRFSNTFNILLKIFKEKIRHKDFPARAQGLNIQFIFPTVCTLCTRMPMQLMVCVP